MTNGMRLRWSPVLAAAVLWLAGAEATTAIAGENQNWTIARRSDAEIVQLVGKLEASLAEMPHLKDSPALVLLRSRTWDAGQERFRVHHNEIVRLADPDYRDAATREQRFLAKADLRYRAAWILRDGRVLRLPADVWKIVRGDEDQATSVYLAFPDVRAGDVLGWSVEEDCDWTWPGGYVELAGDLPVVTSQTRVRTDGTIAYKTLFEHLQHDKWSYKILATAHGAPSEISLSVVDIPARPTGRYAPTELEYLPYVEVVYRGFWLDEARRWLTNVCWNEVAIEGSGLVADLEGHLSEVAAEARAAAGPAATPREKAAAVHRHVRDDFVLVDPFLVRSRREGLAPLVASRQATRWEKGVLMFAMCRALGLDVDLLAGRGSFVSPIDKANPYLGQLAEPIVRLVDGTPIYYTPQDPRSAPGVLPPYLRGTEALELPRGVGERAKELQHDALNTTGFSMGALWDEYCRLVKLEDLTRWVPLPGDPDELMATSEESLSRLPDLETLPLQLRLTGHSDLQFDLRGGGDDRRLLADYLATRWEDAEAVEANCIASPLRDGERRLNGIVRAAPLPAPTGDDWVIPGGKVFGQPFLHDWDNSGAAPFIGRVAEAQRYVWRAPLPTGWADAAVPPPFAVDHPQFRYLCRFASEDGYLVATREVEIRRAITMYGDIAAFAAAVARVQDFERMPVVVTRR
jgi:hypothetical protein